MTSLIELLVCLIFNLTSIVYFRGLCKNVLIIAAMVPLPSFLLPFTCYHKQYWEYPLAAFPSSEGC